MEQEQNLPLEEPQELDILEREDRCRRALKTVGKALFMRLFVTALLVWVCFQTSMDLWIIGLMAVVVLINLAGALPLYSEWKRQRKIVAAILEEDDTL